MEWSKEDIEKLIELYPTHTNKEIANILNIDFKYVIYKSKTMKLKKNISFVNLIKRNNAIKNKKYISFSKLKKIAKKYASRYEFQKNDLLAYRIARRDGVLNKVCSHMTKQGYSSPQLALYYIVKNIINTKIVYNGRKIIAPYELDLYLPKYNLAFEYDGKPWHKDKVKDEIKNTKCIEHNIILIRIVEKSKKYINDLKEQIIENLKMINLITENEIKEIDILKITENEINEFVNKNILNEKKIKQIIKKYKTVGEFKKNESSLYHKLSKMKVLKEYTKNLKRKRIIWNEEIIKEKIKKYEVLNDFVKNENACYLYMTRNNLKWMLNNLRLSISRPITIEEIFDDVLNNDYKKISDFQNKRTSMYNKARSFGIIPKLKEIINLKKF
jgi:hypothetical protein